jgi:hypothetical protein
MNEIIKKNSNKMIEIFKEKTKEDLKCFIDNNNVDINFNEGFILNECCYRGDTDFINYLLTIKELDINVDGYTIIEDLVSRKDVCILDLFKERIDFNISFRKFKVFKLIIATENIDYFKYIVNLEKDIDFSLYNNSLLFKAIKLNKIEIINYLLTKESVLENINSLKKNDMQEFSNESNKLINLIMNTHTF